MPKEQINYPLWRKTLHGLPGLSGSDEGATADIDPVLMVRWHDGSAVEGHVQLSIVRQETQLWKDFEEAESWPPGNSTSERYSPVLSREEINRLIKTLRRARDSAYGHDE